VGEAFERARALLEARLATLERGAAQLLASETLDEAALRGLVDGAAAADCVPSIATPPATPPAVQAA
jgi:hypothetical protein